MASIGLLMTQFGKRIDKRTRTNIHTKGTAKPGWKINKKKKKN